MTTDDQSYNSTPKPPTKRGLGAIKDTIDPRDHVFVVQTLVTGNLPSSVDLVPEFEIYSQGSIGSCTANALAGAIQFDRLKNGQAPDFTPSRLFIYYNERQISGHVTTDSGSELRTGISCLQQQGVCPEDEWTYDDTSADPDDDIFPAGAKAATKPTAQCYADALSYKIKNYKKVAQNIDQLRGCLASGYPFVFSFEVYHAWYDPPVLAETIPLPTAGDTSAGRHAVLCVGYDNATSLFRIRNSWGDGVGDGGYFHMPYEYLTRADLASDFWVINTVAN